jgi:hypothetical protein
MAEYLPLALRAGTLEGVINVRELTDEQLEDFNIRLTVLIETDQDVEEEQEYILEEPEDPQQMAEAEERLEITRKRLDKILDINSEVCEEITRRSFERDDNRAVDRLMDDENQANQITANILTTLRGNVDDDEFYRRADNSGADILDSMRRRPDTGEEDPPAKKSKEGGRY